MNKTIVTADGLGITCTDAQREAALRFHAERFAAAIRWAGARTIAAKS